MALKDELVPKPRQKSVKRHVWNPRNPRKTAKKLPNVASDILEKQPFPRDSVACGRSQENSFEKSSSRQENTMALKDELVPKPRQKSA